MAPQSLSRRKALQGMCGGGLSLLAGCSASDILVGAPDTASEHEGQGTPTDAPVATDSNRTLSLGLIERPESFDPISTAHVPSQVVFQHVFEGLYEYDLGIDPKPRLAKEEPDVAEGGTRWTVELRPQAIFQNGQPVTAGDVRYSFKAPVEERTDVRPQVQNIEHITSVNDSRIEFELDEPDPSFIHTLTRPVVPASVREQDIEAFGSQRPVGSGPFEFAEWTGGGIIRLVRWSDYWGTKPAHLAELVFTFSEQPSERVDRFSEGMTDVIEIGTNQTWREIDSITESRLLSTPALAYFYLAFNCAAGPTSDKKVREAVDYTVDLDAAVEAAIEPIGNRQYSPFPPPIAKNWNLPTSDWEAIPHERDIETAASIFEERSVPFDYPWEIIVPPDDRREQLAENIADGLRASGMRDVTVSRLEWGAFLGRYTSGEASDYNMYLLGWRNDPDPGDFVRPLFGRSPDVLGVTNGTYYGANSEPGMKAIQKISEAGRATDMARRSELYSEAVTTILKERAHLPLYYLNHAFGVKQYVRDGEVVPTDDKFHVYGESNNLTPSN